MRSSKTFWFEFNQTNSGGFFNEDLGYALYVEARFDGEADARAQAVGVYFNGVADNRDCECCGDRWHKSSNWRKYHATELPDEIKGLLLYASSFGMNIKILPFGKGEVVTWVGGDAPVPCVSELVRGHPSLNHLTFLNHHNLPNPPNAIRYFDIACKATLTLPQTAAPHSPADPASLRSSLP